MSRRLIVFILVLALASLACGLRFNLPVETKSPGPDIVETLSIPYPEAEVTRLSLGFGAGKMFISPGKGNDLVAGTATFNIADFKPEINVDDANVRIRQGSYTVRTIPDPRAVNNEWNLQLGPRAIDLTIEAGAYEAKYEFGGLSLTGLTIKDGASDVSLKFSAPNNSKMDILRYETGASSVTLSGLSNANFSTMIFRAGAGSYTLDFAGLLQRDATVTIDAGLSNITLVVPEGISARVTVEGGLSNVSTGSGWTKNGDVYTKEGSGPVLTFVVTIGAGNLTLSR